MAEAEREPSLADKEDLWGLLLGNKLDRTAQEDRNVTNLVRRFCENKEELVRFYHQSVSKLLGTICEANVDEAEDILLFLWAEYQWRRKRTGREYRLDTDFDTELDRLRDEDNIVQNLNDDFALVWILQEKRHYLKQSDSIQSRVLPEAQPVFIKLDNDQTIEVRGSARLIGKFDEELAETDSVQEVEPDLTEEPILDTLSEFFETEMEVLTLIEARFHSTSLPGESALVLQNKDGINQDLTETPLYAEYLDTQSLADVDYLKFYHEKSGVQVRISVEQGDEGITFDVDDSNLPEDEKKNVRQLLKEKVGISVDDLYPYDPQHHKDHIINRILAEDEDVYRNYIDKLDNESHEFIEEFVMAEGEDTLHCFTCDETFWEPNLDDDKCPNCGQRGLLRGGNEFSVDVDEQAILEAVRKQFHDFGIDIDDSEGTRLLDFDFDSKELDNNTYLRSTFHLAETARESFGRHWYEYYTYCLGNGDIPSRINDYLLETVLITYGRSAISGRENFGTISLYEFLEGDDSERLFVEAVKENRSKLRKRIREQADAAYERLVELHQKVEDGTIEDAGYEKRQELKAGYDYDEFERDVFYLLKEMFLFTERWGREGLKETDGCLFVPDGSDGYFVASYDPKLTYIDEGYNLDSHEKDKAAYYILSEDDHDYISKLLGDGASIDGHIFISDIFREGQFDHVAETVQDWFSLTKGDDEVLDVPLVFIRLDTLLELYDVFQSEYNFIVEYGEVQQAFRGGIRNQFSTTEDYVEFDEDAIDAIKAEVLDARDSLPKKRAAKPHSDSG